MMIARAALSASAVRQGLRKRIDRKGDRSINVVRVNDCKKITVKTRNDLRKVFYLITIQIHTGCKRRKGKRVRVNSRQIEVVQCIFDGGQVTIKINDSCTVLILLSL